jgi:tryptophanyl-tRNA synthetase
VRPGREHHRLRRRSCGRHDPRERDTGKPYGSGEPVAAPGTSWIPSPGSVHADRGGTAVGRVEYHRPAVPSRPVRAVADADGEVAYDPERKPGVSNLLAILAACAHQEPDVLARQFGRYDDLKQAVADAVVATLTPVRDRYLELSRDPEHIRSVLRAAAARASGQAREKVRQAKAAIGLLPG